MSATRGRMPIRWKGSPVRDVRISKVASAALGSVLLLLGLPGCIDHSQPKHAGGRPGDVRDVAVADSAVSTLSAAGGEGLHIQVENRRRKRTASLPLIYQGAFEGDAIMSPSGRYFAVLGSHKPGGPQRISILDLTTGTSADLGALHPCTQSFDSPGVTVLFSPDERALLTQNCALTRYTRTASGSGWRKSGPSYPVSGELALAYSGLGGVLLRSDTTLRIHHLDKSLKDLIYPIPTELRNDNQPAGSIGFFDEDEHPILVTDRYVWSPRRASSTLTKYAEPDCENSSDSSLGCALGPPSGNSGRIQAWIRQGKTGDRNSLWTLDAAGRVTEEGDLVSPFLDEGPLTLYLSVRALTPGKQFLASGYLARD
jgi:hypothetical protein